ncbi:SIMPL domain-containing protein [uncultured Methylibium sp.]|uniref:SIMPL domain-containing protein n=1 Tax=uncultured Methylibium sp. TaxID=381093 RepID=UPI0025E23D58|nr:SIMPL domain-containing protein [uncultured Methylibium sp.]
MPNASRSSLAGLAAAAALTLPPVQAAEPARENLVSFSTSAQIEVTKDLLGITLQVVRDGNDSAAVQAQLKQVLDAALAEAKKAAAPGAMEVRTGGFSLFPRYGKDGKINGWQGQAELVLEGKDSQRVAQTAGKLGTMNVTSVGYSISRELAEKHEAEVTAQAIRKYRAKAQEYAQQFGFAGYQIREVNVQAADQGGGPQPYMVRAKTQMSMASDAPVPVEPGKGLITATVSGSVQLTK